MDYKALGMQIFTYRKLIGMTQADLAQKVGISNSYIGHIERGTRKMGIDILVKISEVLNVSCDALLSDSLPKKSEAEMDVHNKRRLLKEIADILTEN